MTDNRDLAIRAFAEARGVAPEALDLDSPLDEEDYDLVLDQICARAGVDPEAVISPNKAAAGGGLAVAGLRRLAAVSPRAAEGLGAMRLRWEVDTIGSVLASLEAGRPVGSGRWEEAADRPIPPGRALLQVAGWTLLPGAGLTLALWSGCDPACRPCATLAETLPVGLGLPALVVGGWHIAMLAAALRAMRRPGVAEAPL